MYLVSAIEANRVIFVVPEPLENRKMNNWPNLKK